MPTARELLEQADALMKRKAEMRRAEAAEPMQGPVTDSAFAPTEGPPTLEREAQSRPEPARAHEALARIPDAAAGARPAGGAATLSALRWSAPAAPAPRTTTSPAFAPPPALSPRTIQREPIAPSRSAQVDPHEALPAPVAPALTPRPAEPDFPTLTEAVDAMGVEADEVPLLTDAVDALLDEPAADLGAPSVWSPTFGGATTVRAPAAPAAVPQPPSAPPAGRDPLGLDLPPPGFKPAPQAEWADATDAQPVDDAAAAVREEAGAGEEALAAVEMDAPVGEAAEVAPEAAPASAAAPVLAPLDDARVRAIAEEIGMQVLQRIDIFTDTELRARLGERLKPVVDRVSADLVAAINQHVGELLRAYVAEAIEREIDGWRDRQS